MRISPARTASAATRRRRSSRRRLVAATSWLPPEDVAALLACYGLPIAEQRIVSTAREAAKAAGELGGPVAVKAIAPGLVHKSDAGAVALNLRGPDEVYLAAQGMAEQLAADGHAPTGFVVQQHGRRRRRDDRGPGPGSELRPGAGLWRRWRHGRARARRLGAPDAALGAGPDARWCAS